MTSLVVHFCSAPLVCFVDALDRQNLRPGQRVKVGSLEDAKCGLVAFEVELHRNREKDEPESNFNHPVDNLLWHEGKVRTVGDGSFELADMLYSVNVIPLGGFVRLAGESNPMVPLSLASRRPWERVVVLAAGTLMNALLPLAIFTIMFMLPQEEVGRLAVTNAETGQWGGRGGYPAGRRAAAGRRGAGREPAGPDPRDQPERRVGNDRARGARRAARDDGAAATLRRGQQPLACRGDRGAGGQQGGAPVPANLGGGTSQLRGDVGAAGAAEAVGDRDGVGGVGTGAFRAHRDRADDGRGQPERRAGWLMVGILLSINLAIINILPFPMLDAGRIVFVVIEWVRRGKRISPEKEGLIHLVGLAVIIAGWWRSAPTTSCDC